MALSPTLFGVAAGSFGALAAVCGKFAGLCGRLPAPWDWVARAGFYTLLVVCNATMMTCYVRSLRRLPSLQATLLSTSSNILITGLLGWLLFSEALPPRWFGGVALIIGGLYLISHASLAAPAPHPDTRKAD